MVGDDPARLSTSAVTPDAHRPPRRGAGPHMLSPSGGTGRREIPGGKLSTASPPGGALAIGPCAIPHRDPCVIADGHCR